MQWLAELGILATPGIFYGEAGQSHIRIALTATDEQIAAAARRITTHVDTDVVNQDEKDR